MAEVRQFMNSRVLLWFQGSKRKDAKLEISKVLGRYIVQFSDPEQSSYNYRMSYSTYAELVEYIDLLFDNILIDDDELTPFEHVQWDIPGFTTSMIKLENADDNHVYRTFSRCLKFFMDHKH